jgi:hypothetical protein
MKKVIHMVVVTWILSLTTTLTGVYFASDIFSLLTADKIANNVIVKHARALIA